MHQDHPGFEKAAMSMAKKENLSMSHARAIMASAARNASPAAKKANPRLKRVK